MTRAELIELIRNDENSGVEFKRDDVSATKLAAEIAALLNLRGGHILPGVENDQTVSGLTRDPRQAEEWVMEVARVHVQPATIPYWETIRWDHEKVVGIVSLSEDAPDKPYKAKRGSAWTSKVRVGTMTRDATRDEEARLYQQSGRIEYGPKPVQGAEPLGGQNTPANGAHRKRSAAPRRQPKALRPPIRRSGHLLCGR